MQGISELIKKNWKLAFSAAGLLVLVVATTVAWSLDQSIPTYQVRVIKDFPHDSAAFCQGLVVEGDTLFEGTGQYGNSTLRKVDLKTGKVETSLALGEKYFGEGITVFGDRIYQLTWKERVCLVYDKATFQPIGSLHYTGDGWGLTCDEKQLYLSDGSSTLRVLDPQTFKVLRRIRVTYGNMNLEKLNELEFVDGQILANIWYSDTIARIDPITGKVTAWIDCSGIFPASSRPREHVLNGIAHDIKTGRLFVTGKNWPNLFEIEIINGQK